LDRYILSAVLLCSLATGCMEPDVDASTLSIMASTCAKDTQCAPDQVCDDTYGICVADTRETVALALVATPPAQSDAVPAHQPDVMFTPGEPLRVTLPTTVLVTGTIQIAGNYLEPASVPATVLAVATTDVVPGLYRSASAVADNAGFELKLEAGAEYRLSIRADDRTRPTYTELVQVGTDTAIDIILPDLNTLPHISGRIMQAEEALNRPLANVTVTAVEMSTNARCASTTTDSLGAYDIACPTPGEYVLRVSPATDGPPVPRFDAVFDGTTGILLEKTVELPPLVLPLQSRTTTVSLEVNSSDAVSGLEGVEISLAAVLEDSAVWTNAVYVVHGSTNEGGDLDLAVLPGSYDVNINPSTMAPYGATQDKLTVDTLPVSLKVNLEPKPILRGTIRSREGVVVARAQVEALMQITDPATGTIGTREYSVHADDDGYYELPVDTGIVTLNVLPPDDSALPRWSDLSVEVLEDVTIDIELPGAHVVTGWVEGTALEYADGISVELFRSHTDGLRLIARGYTTETGHFMMILPAP